MTGRQSHAVKVKTAKKSCSVLENHGVISVNRRNNWHQVRILKNKYHPLYLKVPDDEVMIQEETGKLQAHRHIYTKSFCKLYKCYIKELPLNFVSHSIFHHLKPFYIGRPSEKREAELPVH